MKPIGLIAGSGQFPIIFSKAARAKGFSIHAAAYVNEADPELVRYVDTAEWLHLGQIKRLLKYFKKNDVSQAVMLGGITKTPNIHRCPSGHQSHCPDRRYAPYPRRRPVAGVCGLFEQSRHRDLHPQPSCCRNCWRRQVAGPAANRPGTRSGTWNWGWKVAKEIGRLDIGQCVVVGGGSVLAVEAIDGTDATVRRGGALGKGHAVAVKVCKPNQDMRFDVPAVGYRDRQEYARRRGAPAEPWRLGRLWPSIDGQ